MDGVRLVSGSDWVESIQIWATDRRTVDVRIRCKDHQPSDGLGAHKVLLAAASPDFLSLVLVDPDDPMVCLHLPDYTSYEVGAILSLLYYGEVWLSPETVDVHQRLLNDLQISVKLSYNPRSESYELRPRDEPDHLLVKCEVPLKTEPDSDVLKDDLVSVASEVTDDSVSTNEKPVLHCNQSKHCKFMTSSLSQFQSHRLVHHRKRERGRCPVCSDVDVADLDGHLRDAHFEPSRPCLMGDDCDVVCDASDDFVQHVKEFHAKRLRCDFEGCRYSTTDSSNLTQHFKSHNDERNFECSVCQQKFLTSSHLKVHTRSVHTKEKTLKCDFCDDRFSTLWQKKSHAKTHHLKAKKSIFPCSICSKSFYKYQSLAAHLKTCRPTPPDARKSFQVCETCGEQLKGGATRLRRHQCVCRTGDVELRCPMCSKTVLSKSLKSHIQYHRSCEQNKHLMSCLICNKSFTTSTALKRHLLIHENAKPFECSSCSKTFRQKGALEVHRRIHSGIRFSCECGKLFISKSLLNQHKKTSADCQT